MGIRDKDGICTKFSFLQISNKTFIIFENLFSFKFTYIEFSFIINSNKIFIVFLNIFSFKFIYIESSFI